MTDKHLRPPCLVLGEEEEEEKEGGGRRRRRRRRRRKKEELWEGAESIPMNDKWYFVQIVERGMDF